MKNKKKKLGNFQVKKVKDWVKTLPDDSRFLKNKKNIHSGTIITFPKKNKK